MKYLNVSSWSPCSVSCGGGNSTRNRKYHSPSPGCHSNLEETKFCNTHCCPVNGKWSVWSSWSSCSQQCNSGLKKRTRECKSPSPSCGGHNCDGSSVDFQECNIQPCGIFKFKHKNLDHLNT